MANPRRYKASKVLYVVLLWVSLPIDIALGIGLYEWLEGVLLSNFLLWITLILSATLAAGLYILYLWQMEVLTDKREHREY